MNKELNIKCQCGSEIVNLMRFPDEEETYLTIYSYSSERYSFLDRLKILFGVKTRTTDIVLSKEDWNKLKQF